MQPIGNFCRPIPAGYSLLRVPVCIIAGYSLFFLPLVCIIAGYSLLSRHKPVLPTSSPTRAPETTIRPSHDPVPIQCWANDEVVDPALNRRWASTHYYTVEIRCAASKSYLFPLSAGNYEVGPAGRPPGRRSTVVLGRQPISRGITTALKRPAPVFCPRQFWRVTS